MRVKSKYWQLLLLLIIDLCVLGANRQHLAIGFIPLIYFLFYPGYLLLRLLKLDSLPVWVKLPLSIGLGIVQLYLVGIVINTILPILGDKKPLALLPIAIACNVSIILLLSIAHLRGIDFHIVPKLNFNSKVALSCLLGLLPLLAAGGALRVNNGGSGIVSLVVLAVITLISTVVFLKLNYFKSCLPYFFYIVSLALLFLWSIRSYHLSGSDIGLEHYVYQLAFDKSRWLISSYHDPYNACLSLTVMPVMLSHLSNYSGEWIFKFWYPLLFAFLTPLTFITIQKLKNTKLAYLAALFFCTQSIFILWMPMLARQEIAFLFFGLLLLILFGDLEISNTQKKVLCYIFTGGLILSHYSTAYVTFLMLFLGYIFKFFLDKFARSSDRFGGFSFIGPVFLLAFFLFTFMWQMQLTTTGGNVAKVVTSTVKSLAGGNSDDKNGAVNKVFSFNPFNAPNAQATIDLYKQQISSQPINSNYPNAQNYDNDVLPVSTYVIPARNKLIAKLVSFINAIDSIVIRLALPVGLLIMLLQLRKRHHTEILAISASLILLMIVFVAFPFISTVYNIERLYQQALMILSLPIVLGLYAMLKPLKRKGLIDAAVIVLIFIFFWYNTGITAQLFGGQPSALMNNYGYYYDQNYTTTSEVKTIEWLSKNHDEHTKVYADKASERVVISYGGIINIDHDLFPDNIAKQSYVYLSRANVINNEMFQYINSNYVILTAPKNFLQIDKNKIYATNQTQIYR